MSDKIELLPCPFCGGENMFRAGGDLCGYHIFCDDCFAESGTGETEEEAAEIWNHRVAAPPAPVAQEPVAFVSQETFSSDGTSDILTRNLPIGTALYTAPPAAEQPTRALQILATISRMARNEACRSGAPAAGQLCTWDAIADMADAALAESPAAEQPACPGCNGHGLVGGFVSAESGYDAEECPFCCGDGFIHGTECGACDKQPDTGHELYAELYQILGDMGASEAVLDQVLAASQGEPLPHASLLPYAAQQPDTVAVPRELYTCIGKGGTYELIGKSQGAGELKHQQLVVYRSAETGLLYHRTPDDFHARMALLAGGAE